MSFLSAVKNTDGAVFEKYCARMLKRLGYKRVRLTKQSGDNGADILCRKGMKKYAIQCKRQERNVSNKAVQEAHSGKGFYDCDVAVVLTNSAFTEAAKGAAEKLGVILWDGEELKKMSWLAFGPSAGKVVKHMAESRVQNGLRIMITIVIAVIIIFITLLVLKHFSVI